MKSMRKSACVWIVSVYASEAMKDVHSTACEPVSKSLIIMCRIALSPMPFGASRRAPYNAPI